MQQHELDRIYEAIPPDRQIVRMFSSVSDEILSEYDKTEQGVIYKPDNSPQALADRISSEMILEYLRRNSPFPVLSEEVDYDDNFNPEIFWIVDPLDGTREFLNKTGEFAIMIGLVKDAKPIFGAVYHPLTRMCYMAKKDKGAFLIDSEGHSSKLQVSNIAGLDEARMTMSSSSNEVSLEVARRLGVKDVIIHGSFGLKVGLIARGNAEIYLNPSNRTSIWDSAPNIVILTEAGGQMTDLSGNELSINPTKKANENGIVATNGQNHFRTVAAIREIIHQIRPQ